MPTNQALSANETTTPLKLLLYARIATEAKLHNFNRQTDIDESDEEMDYECPTNDKVLRNGGSRAIQNMRNFTQPKFDAIWNGIEAQICAQ